MKKKFTQNISENSDYELISYLTSCTARCLWRVLGQLMFYIKLSKQKEAIQQKTVQERKL